MTFSANEVDQYERAKDKLLVAFERWSAQQQRAADPFAVLVALDYKFDVDGDLANWRPGDVRDLLTRWFPRKATMTADEYADVPATMHAMVDFFAARQLSNGSGAAPAELHAAVDAHRDEFLAAMADERNFDIGKFWGTRMVAEGVDLSDEKAVETFIQGTVTGEVDVDHDVLDGIMQRQFGDAGPDLFGDEFDAFDDEPPELPPVQLPSAAELTAEAETSRLLPRLRTFVEWVSEGKTLTKTGRLTVAQGRELAGLLDVDQPYLAKARSSADLPEVSLVVTWAKATRLVRPVRGRLVPVKSAAKLMRQPLELWERAFESVEALGPLLTDLDNPWEPPSLFGANFTEALSLICLPLYAGAGIPLPVDMIQSLVREALNEQTHVLGPWAVNNPIQHRFWRRDVNAVLSALELLGAVRSQPADKVERVKIAELVGPDADPTVVAMTGIGLWAMNRQLRAEGADAPVAGELAEGSFDVLIPRLGMGEPDLVDREIAGWVAARPAETAAADIAGFIAASVEPGQRLLAFQALTYAGEPGVAEARRLREAGGLIGATCTAWLVEREALDAESATDDEILLGFVDHVAGLHDMGALVPFLSDVSVPDRIALVHQLGAVDHPQQLDLLDAIAGNDPERKVARAAGKVRLKIRSAKGD